MTNPTPDKVEPLPSEEELIAILESPNSPPRLTLDLTNSDGDATGIVHAELDRRGKLVLTRVS